MTQLLPDADAIQQLKVHGTRVRWFDKFWVSAKDESETVQIRIEKDGHIYISTKSHACRLVVTKRISFSDLLKAMKSIRPTRQPYE